jgi:uncharacterized protein YfaS (alpha-2-macroglobulin family)
VNFAQPEGLRQARCLDHLTAGKWQIRFGLRVVTPGDFRVLPAQTQAMYVPEICANSDVISVRVELSK